MYVQGDRSGPPQPTAHMQLLIDRKNQRIGHDAGIGQAEGHMQVQGTDGHGTGTDIENVVRGLHVTLHRHVIRKQDGVVPEAGVYQALHADGLDAVGVIYIAQNHGIPGIAPADGDQRKAVRQGRQVAGGEVHGA